MTAPVPPPDRLLPPPTSMYDQKSPNARLRHTSSINVRIPCARRGSTPSAERRVGQARIGDSWLRRTRQAGVRRSPIPLPHAPSPTRRPPPTAECRRGHHADDRIAVVEQRDERGPHRHAADVVLRAVDGIDHPLARARRRSAPNSSPQTASPGRASASRHRSACSTARSASLTGVRSGLVSTCRSTRAESGEGDAVGDIGEGARKIQVRQRMRPRPNRSATSSLLTSGG